MREAVQDLSVRGNQGSRRLRNRDRQNVVYAAALLVVMPRSAKRACMPMRRVSLSRSMAVHWAAYGPVGAADTGQDGADEVVADGQKGGDGAGERGHQNPTG
jgi:hypothetical protein